MLRKRTYRHAMRATLVTIIIFGVCSYFFQRHEQRQHARSLAAVTAISLTPSANGDLSDSILRLLQEWDRLRAVVALDSDNRVLAVLPNDPAYRQVVQQAVDAGRDWSELATIRADVHEYILAVVVPLQRVNPAYARRVAVVFEHNFDWSHWFTLNLIFMTIVTFVNAAYGLSLSGWLLRKVSRPVRELVNVATSCEEVTELPAHVRSDRWQEYTMLYDAFWRINQELASHDTNLRRLKRESEWKLRDRELGLGRQLRRAQEQAMYDPLTKLLNRRFLDVELERLFAAQQARDEDLSIVMVDVDHFKEHNDTQGHASGDSVLVFVGELLRGAIRPTDHAVRYGGDEFVLLLPGIDDKDATAVADRIVKLFSQYISTKNYPSNPPLSLSAGIVSLIGSQDQRGADLLARADKAMYAAKKKGKNTISTGV